VSENSPPLPHSAIYFGDARDFWWNPDQIDLVAKRLDLPRHRRVLDVGCGYGHWARLWLPRLARGVEIVGIDPEARSLAEAASRTAAFLAARGLDAQTSYREAKVEQLPFDDGAFDLVTAQTVLIHVADMGIAITEMTRVLAPGGLLLLAEPTNLAGSMTQLMTRPDFDIDRTLRALELEMRIQRGKHLLGEGFTSAGEYLPRHLDPERFASVRQWLCDKPYGLFPPYDRPGAQDEIAEYRDFADKGWHDRTREEALRFYLAGGGTTETFEPLWTEGLADDRRRLAEIDAGTYAHAGGHVFHLFAATKR
jgi:ubiquinone/menaquinone biosynthesis C-methylase UbiE